MIPHQLSLNIEKRWREKRQRFIPPDECARPEDYTVRPITEAEARAFVTRHHYSSTMPAARLSVGLLREGNLVGAAIFSHPMSQAVLTKWLGTTDGCELGRFVLLDSEKFNAETIFLKRALRILKAEKPNMRGVVSFADPVERRDPYSNEITKRAHFGGCYKAKGAEFLGRSTPRTLLVAPNGAVISPRAISKVRGNETGRDYAERQLVDAGIESRRSMESGTQWLQRVAHEFTSIRHPGNLTFSFTLK